MIEYLIGGLIAASIIIAVGYYNLFIHLKEEASASMLLQAERLDLEMDKRFNAERKATELEARALAASKAIEGSALPWFPKNDRLEARFEGEAMDKLDNPVVSWDSIPGLGGTDGS